MKRRSFFSISGVLLVIALLFPVAAGADVSVGINIFPPPIVLSAPPAVMVVPGTYVYFIPDLEVDILFYGGWWYRPYRGYWYRAKGYNGPWVHVEGSRVPSVVIALPPHFRNVPPGHTRIPYGQLKKNWKTWERERHWDKGKGARTEKKIHKKKSEGEGRRGNGRSRGKGRH